MSSPKSTTKSEQNRMYQQGSFITLYDKKGEVCGGKYVSDKPFDIDFESSNFESKLKH